MLPKSLRLSRTEFTQVFGVGRRIHSPELTLIYKPQATFKAAVVVSKKVGKRAHERATIRRRLYTELAEVARTGATSAYIVLTKPPLVALSRAAQRSALRSLLGRTTKER